MTEQTATTEPQIFWIANSKIDLLDKEIAKLNKRADKLECPHIAVVNHGEREIHDPAIVRRKTEAKQRNLLPAELELIPFIKQTGFEITGEGPKLEGYKFVGTLDHYTIPGKVIVNAVPGETVPAQFFEVEAICHHCNKIRRRVETFIFEKEDDGTYMQVGRTCLKDYFGHDPSAIARWLTRVINFVGSLEDEERWGYGGGRAEHFYDSLKVLSYTVAMIRSFGWVPRSASDEENCPTAGHVGYALNKPSYAKEVEAWNIFMARVKFEPEEDLKEAEAAAAWLETQEGNNEYMHNLKLLEGEKRIPAKMLGYWCSLVAAYQRDQDRLERAKKTLRVNEYYGEIKDRPEFEVKCVGLNYVDGYYGTVCIHRMLGVEGHSFIWFANADAKMKKGAHYNVRATIKKHEEYKDWKQTHVNRLAVIEEIEKEEENES